MTTTVRTGYRGVMLMLAAGDARQVFTRPAQDGINRGRPAIYRVAQIGIYDDGSIWVWAEQLTKAGAAYMSGMGLTLGNEDRLAEIYGQDVADVVAEAVAEHRAARELVPPNTLVQLTRGRWASVVGRVVEVQPDASGDPFYVVALLGLPDVPLQFLHGSEFALYSRATA